MHIHHSILKPFLMCTAIRTCTVLTIMFLYTASLLSPFLSTIVSMVYMIWFLLKPFKNLMFLSLLEFILRCEVHLSLYIMIFFILLLFLIN